MTTEKSLDALGLIPLEVLGERLTLDLEEVENLITNAALGGDPEADETDALDVMAHLVETEAATWLVRNESIQSPEEPTADDLDLPLVGGGR